MPPTESDQFGCTVEVVGTNPLVDLVFVHGLSGHPRKTWTSHRSSEMSVSQGKRASKGLAKLLNRTSKGKETSQTSVFWPVDLLAQDIGDLRIITFGYDADISKFLSRTSDRSIFSIAQDLVVRLEMLRDSTGLADLPIIFVAHSLGGIVVKDALKFSQDQEGFQSHLFSIFQHTYGVIFFGTPHRGSEMASIGRIAARVAGVGLAESRHELLRSLETGSSELERISDSFSRMLPKQSKGLQIYSFLEGLPLTGFSIAGKVVEDASSIIGDAFEGKVVVQANHMDMCRFHDRSNSDYQLVSGVIRRWSRMAPKPTDVSPSIVPELILAGRSESREKPSTSTGLPTISLESNIRLPFEIPQLPSRHFCGREEELFKIGDMFRDEKTKQNQRILALHGLGGVGKTQLCLSYAVNHEKSYSAIFWINATSERTIGNSFRQIAQSMVDWAARIREDSVNFSTIAHNLGLSQLVSPTTGEVNVSPKESEVLSKAVVKWLERPENSNWLMVFDSADDLEGLNLQAYFPRIPQGDILISSRRSESALLGNGLEVKCLEPISGRDLLQSQAHLQDDQYKAGCEQIAKALGYLPLALAQAGSYMAATNTAPQNFLQLYHKQRQLLLQHKPPTAVWQYKETVFTTWNISFSAISRDNPAVATLLLLLGYMQPDDIWDGIFTLSLRKDGRRRRIWETFWKPVQGRRKRFLSRLKFSDHARKRESSSVFHKITWLEEIVSMPIGLTGAFSTLVAYSLVNSNAAGDGVTIHPLVQEWCKYQCTQVSPMLSLDFVILVGRSLDLPEGLEDPAAAVLVRRIGPHVPSLMEVISWAEESNIAPPSVDLCHAMEAFCHLLGRKYSNYRLSDRLHVAKFLFDQTSIALGLKNQLTLVILGELALCHEECQLLDDAVRLAGARVKISTKLLGPIHFDTRHALHNFAKSLEAQGTDRQFARQIYESNLERHKAAAGDYRDGISTLMNLGMLLMDQNELDQARTYLEESIRLLEQDEQKQLLLDAYGFLGLIASAQGHQSEAIEHISKAVVLAEEYWGHGSEQALVWKGNFVIEAAARLPFQSEKTMKLIKTNFEDWMARYSGQSTRWVNQEEIRIAEAYFYYECGQSEKAIEVYKSVIESFSAGLTSVPRHRIFRAFNELGITYWDYGLFREALKASERAMEYAETKEHQNTCYLNRAIVFRDMREIGEAERLFQRYLDENPPPDHATLDYTNLASIMQAKGDYVNALQLYGQVIADMEKRSGMSSLLLLTRHRQAELCAIMGNQDEAIDIWTGVFEEKNKDIGHMPICNSSYRD